MFRSTISAIYQSKFHQESPGPLWFVNENRMKGLSAKLWSQLRDPTRDGEAPRIQQRSSKSGQPLPCRPGEEDHFYNARESYSHDWGWGGCLMDRGWALSKPQPGGVETKKKYPNSSRCPCLISCQCFPLAEPKRKQKHWSTDKTVYRSQGT